MKSLVAICLAILIINAQFMAIHLNASVISPPSITNPPPPSTPTVATTQNSTVTMHDPTTQKSTVTMHDLLILHESLLFVTVLTPNLFGYALFVSHCLRARTKLVFNLIAFLGVGWATHAMSRIYSPSLASFLGYISLFVLCSESATIRRFSQIVYERIFVALGWCVNTSSAKIQFSLDK
ncbi:hypothetical protein QL285_005895 [Trifolium repens]|nr:hypothetical protein QL285_005895 [Trifolium repens]